MSASDSSRHSISEIKNSDLSGWKPADSRRWATYVPNFRDRLRSQLVRPTGHKSDTIDFLVQFGKRNKARDF
jgi:hypothetical protein